MIRTDILIIGAGPTGLFTVFEAGLLKLRCHLIDALVAVMGKPASVKPFVRRTKPEKDKLADNMLAVFEYPRHFVK